MKNSPKKKGKDASRKAIAFDAGNLDTTQEIAPLSPVTPCPNTKPPQKKPEPRKIAKIKEVLEVQEGEEVSDEEELVAKLYIQDF